MDPYINLKEGQNTPKPHGPVYKFEGVSRRPRSVMGPYINLTGNAETSWTRRSICMWVKETAKPYGPVDKCEGRSRRPRNLMDPYINLQEGQGDCETSWTRIYM